MIVINTISDFIRLHNIGRRSPSFIFGNSSYTFHKNSLQYRDWIESKIIKAMLSNLKNK